ncbi:MAG: divergent polysaccharide deacetylase family protein [Wolinella sp.]
MHTSNPASNKKNFLIITLVALFLGIIGGYTLFTYMEQKPQTAQESKPKKPTPKPPKPLSSDSQKRQIKQLEELIDKNSARLEKLEELSRTQILQNKTSAKKTQPLGESPRKTPKKEPKNPHKTAPKVQNPTPKNPAISTKPKLAIIIDDVGFPQQVEEIKRLSLKITPSIFPRASFNKESHKLAREFDFYMVHLPLEAHNFFQKEHEWLYTHDTKEHIKERIKALKRDFPNLKYLNNHTGSKFSENTEAMRRLLGALQDEGITYVDSRTTAHSKAQKVAKSLQYPILARDVFLDNERSIPYIKNQLAEAIGIAHKKGYAIAIGHPHTETLQALKESADLLQSIELVYVKELPLP